MPPDLFSKPDIPSDIFAPPVIKDDIDVTETSPVDEDFEDSSVSGSINSKSVEAPSNVMKPAESDAESEVDPDAKSDDESKGKSDVESKVESVDKSNVESAKTDAESDVESKVESAEQQPQPDTPIEASKINATTEKQSKTSKQVVPTNGIKPLDSKKKLNKLIQESKQGIFEVPDIPMNIFDLPNIIDNIDKNEDSLNTTVVESNTEGKSDPEGEINTKGESDPINESDADVESDTDDKSDADDESDAEDESNADDKSDATKSDSTVASQGEVSNIVPNDDSPQSTITPHKETETPVVDPIKVEPKQPTLEKESLDSRKNINKLIQESKQGIFEVPDIPMNIFDVPSVTNEEHEQTKEDEKPVDPTKPVDTVDPTTPDVSDAKPVEESQSVPEITENIEDIKEKVATAVRIYIEAQKQIMKEDSTDDYEDDFEDYDEEKGPTVDEEKIEASVRIARAIYKHLFDQTQKSAPSELIKPTDDGDVDKSSLLQKLTELQSKDNKDEIKKDSDDIIGHIKHVAKVAIAVHNENINKSTKKEDIGKIEAAIRASLAVQDKIAEAALTAVEDIDIDGHTTDESDDDITKNVENAAKISIAVLKHLKEQQNSTDNPVKEDDHSTVDSIKDDHPPIGPNSLPHKDIKSTKFNTENIERAVRVVFAVQNELNANADIIKDDPTVPTVPTVPTDSPVSPVPTDQGDEIKNIKNKVGTAARVSRAAQQEAKKQAEMHEDDSSSIQSSTVQNKNENIKNNVGTAARVSLAAQQEAKKQAEMHEDDSISSRQPSTVQNKNENIKNNVGTAARVSLAAQQEAKKQIARTVDNTVNTDVQKPTVQVNEDDLKKIVRAAIQVKKSLQDANKGLSENKSVDVVSDKPIVDETNKIKDDVGTAVRVSRAAQEEAKKQSSSVQVNKHDLGKFVRVAVQVKNSLQDAEHVGADLDNTVSTAVIVSKNVSEKVNKPIVSPEKKTVDETNKIKDTVGTAVRVSRAAQEEANKLPPNDATSPVQPGHADLDNTVSTAVIVSKNVSEKVNEHSVASPEKTTVDKKYIEKLVRAAVAIQEYINKPSEIGSVDSHNEKKNPTVEVDTGVLKTALRAGIAARNYINKPSSTVKESNIPDIQKSVLAALAVQNEINKGDNDDNGSQVSINNEDKSSIDKIHLGTIIRVVLAVKKHLKSIPSSESSNENDKNKIDPLVTPSSGTDKNTTNRTGVIYTINNDTKNQIRKLFQ